jgi:hypothetical protein
MYRLAPRLAIPYLLETGLMWEKKTGIASGFVVCSTPTDCPDPTSVNNVYTWLPSPVNNRGG